MKIGGPVKLAVTVHTGYNAYYNQGGLYIIIELMNYA